MVVPAWQAPLWQHPLAQVDGEHAPWQRPLTQLRPLPQVVHRLPLAPQREPLVPSSHTVPLQQPLQLPALQPLAEPPPVPLPPPDDEPPPVAVPPPVANPPPVAEPPPVPVPPPLELPPPEPDCVTHWPSAHDWPFPHALQLALNEPHASGEVPSWQAPCASQHPLQLVESQRVAGGAEHEPNSATDTTRRAVRMKQPHTRSGLDPG